MGFGDGSFDGAMVCGAFETMDWQAAPRAIEQVWRVLEAGGRLAILEQDWALVLQSKPRRRAMIRCRGDRLTLRVQ